MGGLMAGEVHSIRQIDVAQLDVIRAVGFDLKLPLIQMANAASLLGEINLEVGERRRLGLELEQASRRMLEQIDSLLFASQVESRQVQLCLAPTNVAAIAYDVSQDMAAMSQMYGCDIKLSVTRKLLPAAVDPVALRHCVQSLLDVLVRTTDGGQIEINIRHQSDSVTLTMRSHGPVFSLNLIHDAIRRLGRAAQPVKALNNFSGTAFFVVVALTRAMDGEFMISQSSGGRNLAIKLPLSSQLQLVG